MALVSSAFYPGRLRSQRSPGFVLETKGIPEQDHSPIQAWGGVGEGVLVVGHRLLPADTAGVGNWGGCVNIIRRQCPWLS